MEAIARAFSAGESMYTELLARRKDSTTFWIGISLSPVHDAGGRVTHYVSVGADITARLEEAREKRRLQDRLFSEMQERERMAFELRFSQKLESVGRLAAGIAHEINTPLQYVGDGVTFLRSGLRGLETLLSAYRATCAQMMEQPTRDATEVRAEIESLEARINWRYLSAEMPRAVERTLDGVSRVTHIVQAMKEFAHPDGGEHGAADVNRAIETTLAVARGEYKHVATIETHLETIPEVLCNIGEINQVLLNLIVNAAHAIETAGKDASVGCISISTARAGPFVEIVVADNGCGIAEENLERIFDPFFTTKEVGRGTGQGLAIARSIVVDKHHGSIDVMSKVNRGTRFRLMLPIAGRKKDTSL